MSPWVVHRDPRWWPDPEAFRPDRFAPDAPRPAPFTYFPFGGGKRACIGRAFALLEGTLILAVLLSRLELEIDTAPGRDGSDDHAPAEGDPGAGEGEGVTGAGHGGEAPVDGRPRPW